MALTLVKLKQPAPVLLIDQEFQDIESLNGVLGWELDWRQIEPGPLIFRLMAFGHADINVIRVEFNRGFHQIGNSPAGFITLGLPDIESGITKSNGADVAPGTLINFNYGNMLDIVNRGEFGGFVISISRHALETALSVIDIDQTLMQEIDQQQFWSPSSGGEHEQLRQILHAVKEVATSEGNDGLVSWKQIFNQDLTSIIAIILSGESHQPGLSVPRFQAGALQRALHVLHEYDRMPNSVRALSMLAGASWSTLERAFLNEFGITPKAYMKVRCLAAVQAELIKQGPDASISDIAGQWGFRHMSSFSADYKKQFGELPSETLRRL